MVSDPCTMDRTVVYKLLGQGCMGTLKSTVSRVKTYTIQPNRNKTRQNSQNLVFICSPPLNKFKTTNYNGLKAHKPRGLMSIN